MITSWYPHLCVYVCFVVCVGVGGWGSGAVVRSWMCDFDCIQRSEKNLQQYELRWWTNGDATDAEYKLVMRNNIINI